MAGGSGTRTDLPHSLGDYSQSPTLHLNGVPYRLRWEPIDYSRSKVLKEDWIDFKSVEVRGDRVKLEGKLSEVARFLREGKQPRGLSGMISENAKDFTLELSLEEARRFKILNAKNKLLETHEFYVQQVGDEERGR